MPPPKLNKLPPDRIHETFTDACKHARRFLSPRNGTRAWVIRHRGLYYVVISNTPPYDQRLTPKSDNTPIHWEITRRYVLTPEHAPKSDSRTRGLG